MKHMIQKYIEDDNYQLLQDYILLPTDQNFGRIFRYFSETSGLFRFVSKQFCLFRLFRYRFETPKQTEKMFFWFHETNRNKRETDLVSVCFGSNRKLFFFISRTPYVRRSKHSARSYPQMFFPPYLSFLVLRHHPVSLDRPFDRPRVGS